MIHIKRVYEESVAEDGACYLVERLWQRGIKKEALHMKAWCKDAAPSHELRRWFSHDPAKWKEFQSRYRAELAAHPAGWKMLLESAQHGMTTLLYSSHDTEHNNAAALQAYLREHLVGKRQKRGSKVVA